MFICERSTKNSTGVHVVAPAGIDPPKDIRDGVRYYLHTILQGFYARKLDSDGTTRIYSQLMRDLLGERRESAVRHWLLDNRVVYTDHVYSDSLGFSKSYGIYPGLADKVKWFELSDRRLAAKIRLARSRRTDLSKDRRQKSGEILAYLEKWANSLEFNRQGCVSYLGDENSIHMWPVKVICAKQAEITEDEYGRLHSPYTRLFTPLRQFISYRGENLHNNDIRNSQLVFAFKVFREYKLGKLIERPLRRQLPSNKGGEGEAHPALCSENNIESVVVQEDKLREWIEKGLLYDNLLDQAHGDDNVKAYVLRKRIRTQQKKLWHARFLEYTKKFDLRTADDWKQAKRRFGRDNRLKDIPMDVAGDVSRDDFKRLVFSDILFGRCCVSSPVTRMFAEQFPDFYAFILEMKREDYADLARSMQRAESGFVYDCVVRRLMEHHREIPVIVIHDSIMTTEEHCPLVRRVFKEEFERIGLRPTIKTE